MLRKLRIRFIGIASVAILIVLFSVVGVLNSARYLQTRNEINRILSILTDNNGKFPSLSETSKELGSRTSIDSIFQYRYFSVTVNASDEVTLVNTDNISDLTDEQITDYAQTIKESKDESGEFYYQNHTYAYQVSQKDKKTLIVVLDATNQLKDNETLVTLSLWMSGVSFVFFLTIVTILSGKVIEPFVRNYEKQRRFITNAGHELKTPLAIISANNELVELMNGESEWTKSTSDQVKRLTDLINGLVSLARLEEQEHVELVLSDLDFSAIAEDAAEDFKGPVIRDGKKFIMEIQPDIHVKAEEKSLFELVTILVDNANKYCDPEGTVTVRLDSVGRTRKRARLAISNTYREGKNVDYSKFFERFYREDESHNSKKSGFGIGLSMAESMVKLFKGSISASYKDDAITFTVIL